MLIIFSAGVEFRKRHDTTGQARHECDEGRNSENVARAGAEGGFVLCRGGGVVFSSGFRTPFFWAFAADFFFVCPDAVRLFCGVKGGKGAAAAAEAKAMTTPAAAVAAAVAPPSPPPSTPHHHQHHCYRRRRRHRQHQRLVEGQV